MTRPTLERIAFLFRVDADNGRVFWKNPPKQHPRLRDAEAGSLRPNHCGKMYCRIKIGRVAINRGHLIFFVVHGRWPLALLDHISGVSTDDRIANLREATVTQNAWNHKKRRKDSSLPMGVRRAVSGRYVARIACNKKKISIGTFDTAEQAAAAYITKRSELYGAFA